MVDKNNKYTRMQKSFYDANAKNMAFGNHKEHNDNPDYWGVLLSDLNNDEINGEQTALDFGCGTGRNVLNLLKNWNWLRVDGIDISENNIAEADKIIKKEFPSEKYTLHVNNGVDLASLKTDNYDFVMSTIVFQHISVHQIRISLMKEIFRVMKPGALFSFQMGYGAVRNKNFRTVHYFDNFYDAKGTNSECDVKVDNIDDLVNDLKEIGYKNISCVIKPSWSNLVHKEWVYVKAYK